KRTERRLRSPYSPRSRRFDCARSNFVGYAPAGGLSFLMAHAHDHGHDHAHAHGAPADWGRAFALGIGINVVFIVIEVAFGFAANSVALLADAAHNASDALGLFVAW